MTVEHRLLYSLADLKAVVLECKKCGVRLSVKPADLNVEKLTGCPTCDQVWLNANSAAGPTMYEPLSRFVASISPALLADANDKPRVRVLLEFHEALP